MSHQPRQFHLARFRCYSNERQTILRIQKTYFDVHDCFSKISTRLQLFFPLLDLIAGGCAAFSCHRFRYRRVFLFRTNQATAILRQCTFRKNIFHAHRILFCCFRPIDSRWPSAAALTATHPSYCSIFLRFKLVRQKSVFFGFFLVLLIPPVLEAT